MQDMHLQVLSIWQDRQMIQKSLLQLQIDRVAAAKAMAPPAVASTAPAVGLPGSLPGVAVPAPKAQSVISLMLDSTKNVTANLENQYGTYGS